MKRTKAQSLSEYTIGLLVIILAFIGMQVYVRRGLQGRYIDLVSQATVRINQDSGGISQYEPYYVDSEHTSVTDTTREENISNGGGLRRDIADNSRRQIWWDTEKINCYEDE